MKLSRISSSIDLTQQWNKHEKPHHQETALKRLYRRTAAFATIFSLLAALLCAFSPAVQAQIYVDGSAAGANDGTSWADAYTSLQDALGDATGSDEIWIAEGVYYPDEGAGVTAGDENASFTITAAQNGLEIYGGFTPGDAFADRSPGDHPVVLSGDIDGNDTKTNGVILTADDINGDNSYHVLYFDARNDGDLTEVTRLDGVTVTGGLANGGFDFARAGGLFCKTNSNTACSPTLTNIIFAGNHASNTGGAIYNNGFDATSSPIINNAIFTGNHADGNGGAIYNTGGGGMSSPTITNTTFTGNSAGDSGGAIYNDNATPTITNSIFWDNGDEISGSTPTISYSLVEGGHTGTGNINADPFFVDAADPDGADDTFATEDDGLRLYDISSAIDAGNNSAISETEDLTGANRIQGTVDLGAYEGGVDHLATTFHVDHVSGSDANDGQSWSTAFATLTKALSIATNNDEIWIAEGTYYPDEGTGVTAGDETASFTITGGQDGLEIYGGFASGDGFADRNPSDHPVVLSGDIGTTGDTSDNSYHVLEFDGTTGSTITNATVLDGVTVTGGNADGSSPNNRGGGMYCIGNSSGNECSPQITNVVFSDNRAVAGGAIYNFGDSGTSSPTIVGSVFNGNEASSFGGAIVNNGNSGGTSSPTTINVTFNGNSTDGDGGAILNSGTSSPIITNSIFFDNGDEISGGSPTISFSLIENGVGNIAGATDGGSNLDADPQFVDSGNPGGTDNILGTSDDGLALQASSPAIDAGNAGLDLPATGLAGRKRLIGTTVDMGAYEGPLTVQITGSEGWRMMTAPGDGLSYADLLGDLWLQGMTGGDVTNGTANVYTWDEASQQFQAISDASTVPDAGQGFIVYVYEDDDYEAEGTQGGFPKTIPAGSAHNSGSVSPTLTYNDDGDPSTTNDGFNLVGNPYGTTINWDAASGWTKTNLQTPMYIWDNSIGDYRSHNGLEGTLEDALIAPWQGFWVQASDADPSLEFTDEVQSTGGEFLKEQKEDPTPQITFELTQSPPGRGGSGEAGSGVGPTRLQSSALLMFAEQAEAGKDRLDAWKLESLAEQYLSLYTTSAERHVLDINALPKELESPLELNLDFKGSDIGGEYTLSWDPKALPDSWKEGAVILTDLHTDRVVSLNKSGEYTFEVDGSVSESDEQPAASTRPQAQRPDEFQPPTHGPIPTVLKAKATNPRFVLTIDPSGSNQMANMPEQAELAQNYPNPFNPETVIRYGVPEQTEVQLNIYDVLGRRVRTLINEQKTPGRYEARFDGSQLASGLYIYRLKVGATIITKKMTLIK